MIVPVYNNIEYLPKCLDSIKEQTYKNLEIICIDDGSDDGCGQYLDEISKRDDRFVVVHQANAGESHARNVGLDMARGEYIAFVDCDDWLDADMYQLLIEAFIENPDLDVACCSWYKEEKKTTPVKNQLEVTKDIFDRNQFLKYLYMRDSYRGFSYMWDKLYKREMLTDGDGKILEFPEDIRLGGDVIYLANIGLRAKRIVYKDIPKYHYRIKEESGSHTKNLEVLQDWLKAYERVLDAFEKENVEPNVIDYVKRFMAYHASNFTRIAIEQKDDEYKKLYQSYMKRYRDEYVKLNLEYPERIKEFEDLLER